MKKNQPPSITMASSGRTNNGSKSERSFAFGATAAALTADSGCRLESTGDAVVVAVGGADEPVADAPAAESTWFTAVPSRLTPSPYTLVAGSASGSTPAASSAAAEPTAATGGALVPGSLPTAP